MPKNFVVEAFCAVFQKISGSQKVYEQEGGGSIKFFRRNLLSHSAEKHRKGALQCFTNFGHQKTLRVNRKNIWHDRDSNTKHTA